LTSSSYLHILAVIQRAGTLIVSQLFVSKGAYQVRIESVLVSEEISYNDDDSLAIEDLEARLKLENEFTIVTYLG